jgi:triacylglycerol lipase
MITDARLAELCAETYDGNPMTFETEGVHFRITVEDNQNVIAFRGSANVMDWLRDFDVLSRDITKLGALQAGFQLDASQAWARIPDDNVILTGHSKGGADAQVIAGMLCAAGLPPLKLTTFGAPRICWTSTDAICALLLKVPGSDYRNQSDPVPLLPVDFYHPRDVAQLGDGAEPLDAGDHDIALYVAAVGALGGAV